MNFLYLILFVILCCLFYLFLKVRQNKLKKLEIQNIKDNLWKIIPANKTQSIDIFKNLLQTDYVKNFSKYDIMSKSNDENAKLKIEYINFAIKQLSDWTPREKIILQNYYSRFINRIIELNMIDMWKQMPNTINIIKSSMKHEGDASGYTIKNNIVLKHLDYDLFVHEVFHVFSRYNPRISENLYKIFKIWVADKLILPYNHKINDLLISNPDTPLIVFTEVTINNEKVLVTPILHSKKSYKNTDTSFFNDMKISLMFVEVRIYSQEVYIVPRDMSHQNINSYFIDMDKVPEYVKKLGNNTDYNIHPEEVCAKQFEFLINNTWKQKKQPELIEKMYNLLKD